MAWSLRKIVCLAVVLCSRVQIGLAGMRLYHSLISFNIVATSCELRRIDLSKSPMVTYNLQKTMHNECKQCLIRRTAEIIVQKSCRNARKPEEIGQPG